MGTFQAKYLPMILALQANPESSIKDIADKINLSWPTTKKRFEEAKELDIIRRIVAHYDYKKLGFRRHFILADLTNYQALKTMEEICDEHPYALFRSRVIGHSGMSLFMIFQLPDTNTADNNLKDLFQILYRSKIIANYTLYTSTGRGISTNFDLDRFDLDKEQWQFNPEKWVLHLSHFMKPIPYTEEKFDLTELNHKLLYILRLMSDNLMPTQTEMRERYESQIGQISKSEFHRQFTYLKDNLVKDVELIYDFKQFGISELYLYILPDLSTTEIEQFFGLMYHEPPPFSFSCEAVGQKHLVMWGNMPAGLAKELSYQLWKRFSQLKMYLLSNKADWSIQYPIYHLNFDDETKTWKDAYEYMVNMPLRHYQDIIKT